MKKVLYVDKDSVDTIMTEAILQHLGYRVKRVKNGWEALINATLDVPDLVLMPLDAKARDGILAIEAFRAKPEISKIQAIATTEERAPVDENEWQALGFNDHVAKPISLANLSAAIGRLNEAPTAASPTDPQN